LQRKTHKTEKTRIFTPPVGVSETDREGDKATAQIKKENKTTNNIKNKPSLKRRLSNKTTTKPTTNQTN